MSDRKKLKMVSLIAAVERARAGEASASSTAPAATAGVADPEVHIVMPRKPLDTLDGSDARRAAPEMGLYHSRRRPAGEVDILL